MCQLVLTTVFAVYMVRYSNVALTMLIPFSGGNFLDPDGLRFLFYILQSSVRSTGRTLRTDSTDWRQASRSWLRPFFPLSLSVWMPESRRLPVRWRARCLDFYCLMYIRQVCLWGIPVRWHWGALSSRLLYMMQMPLFIPIVGLIYLVEVLSVMIQVTYYKKTGGKRIFRMAPIHHHFELGGWSETRVVAVFSIITAILCMIALLAM